MSMNSHSSGPKKKSAARKLRSQDDSENNEVSELLNLFPEGSEQELKELTKEIYLPLDLGKTKSGWSDKDGTRGSPRKEIKMTVLIVHFQTSFRTESVNLSLKGVLIRDSLPAELLNQTFDLVLIHELDQNRKEFIMFQGRAIRDSMQVHRIEFVTMKADSVKKLERLLK